ITLPLSAPGILSGSILVFVLTISALVTPRLLGGPTYQVMSTLIYDEFLSRLNWPAGSAQSLLLTVMVLALVYLSGRLAPRTRARVVPALRGGRAAVAAARVGHARLRLPHATGGGDRARLAQPDLVPDRAAARPDLDLVHQGAERPGVRAGHRLQRAAGARRDRGIARRWDRRIVRSHPAPGRRRRRRGRAAERAARVPRCRGRRGPAAVLRADPPQRHVRGAGPGPHGDHGAVRGAGGDRQPARHRPR